MSALPAPVPPLWFQDASPAAGTSASGFDAAGDAEKWIVQFRTDAVESMTSVDQTASLLAGLPGEFQVVRGLGQVGQVLIQTWGSDDAISAWYAADPVVISFQRDSMIHVDSLPNDPAYSQLWGLENSGQTGGTSDADIDAAAAWDITTGSSSVIVAVLDTGIDYNHPDLVGNIWTNPLEIAGDGIDNDQNGFIDDVHGWDFVNHDSDPMDDNSHGTHVAGTIGAVGNNGIGVTGINWDVSLMALKFLDDDGGGSNSDLIAAINYTTMMRERGHNVRVTNNSYGDDISNPATRNAIQAAGEAGILYIAAAGNTHTNNDTHPFYPASYNLDNIISVAATDDDDQLASFSNYGLTSVDLAAPGVNTYSTTPDNHYGSKSGTSMATPHVVGVAALAMSLVPEASYQQIREAILARVDPLASLAGKLATGGRLNAKNTLNYLLQELTATPPNYLAASTTYEALDLAAGAADVTTVLDDVDDGTAVIDLGGNSFTFYGTTYSGAASIYVSSNGLLTFGTPEASAENSNLALSPLPAAIAPFWDDLRTDVDGLDLVLAKFEDTAGDSSPDRLIIEWSSVGHWPSSSSTATFQVILQLNTGAVDGRIIFNYVDLNFGDDEVDNGRSATVGVKDEGDAAGPRLLVSKGTGTNPLVASGHAILVERTRPVGDIVDVDPDPRSDAVDWVDVSFSQPIDPASFDYRDITLTLNGSVNLITSAVTVSQVDDTTWRINGLAGFTNYAGAYVLTVNMGGVANAVGHFGIGTITDEWTTNPPVPDIVMQSVTANGLTTLTATYQIYNSGVTPFDLGFYRSSDQSFGGDTLLGIVTISALADLSLGVHTKTWTIGSGPGKVALPGAGAVEVDADYFILAVADPTDAIVEVDPDSPGSNNVAVFSGVYHAPLGAVFVHGNGGDDTIASNGSAGIMVNSVPLTYAATDVSSWRLRGHGGDDFISAPAFAKAVFNWGGDGNDNLAGGSVNDLLSGGAGNDTLAGNAGNDILSGEAGNDNFNGGTGNDSLIGGTGDDTYVFNASLTSGIDTVTEAPNEGTDLLDFSQTTNVAIVLNLSSTAVQAQGTRLSVSLSSGEAIENVIGGAKDDVLTGNSLANTLTGGAGNDTLQGAGGDDSLIGGIGNDIYRFNADTALGNDTITELAASGTDLLDFAPTLSMGVLVDLSSSLAQPVNANLTLALSAGDVIENATGGSGNDTLIGNGLINVLTGGAGNDTLTGGAGNDSLVGGANDDTYLFDTDLVLGTDTINESAGGIDTLDFSATTGFAITINLGLSATQVVNSHLSLGLLSTITVENVIAGSLNDSLTGNALDNVLTGGLGNDTYFFDADVASGSDTVVEGSGEGTDLLDFSKTTLKAISVDLSTTLSQEINTNQLLTLSHGEAIENVTGGSLNDTLIGNGLANVLNAGTGNDILEGKAGDDSLIGGSGNDWYNFDTDASLGIDTLNDASGIETLDFSATTTLGITVNLGVATSQAVNSNLSLILGSTTFFDNVVGGEQADTLIGNASVNAMQGRGGNDTIDASTGNDILEGGAGNDMLIGGVGNDNFVFAADTSLGTDTLDEAGGGTDALDFSTTLNSGVNVNLGVATSQVVNGNLTLILGSSTVFEKVTGGAQADILTGNTLANTLIGGGGDDTLAGGAGNDIYLYAADSPLGNDTIDESGGGVDTLDFTPTLTSGITIDLGIASTQAINGNIWLTLGATPTIEKVVGTALADTITGNSLANTLVGGNGNDTLNGAGGNDIYVFDTDTQLGTDTLTEPASGSGIDLLDFSATTTLAVTVNLSITGPQTVNANLSLNFSADNLFENVTGGTLGDTLTGNALANVLTGGTGDDALNGGDGNDTLIGGAGNDALTGGTGNDIYSFTANAALGTDTLVEADGGGIDLLDFSTTTTLGVSINLSSGSTQMVNSNLSLNLSGADYFEFVIGTGLADNLTGNVANNLLIGGAGVDTLSGLGGRDLLFGGTGADTLHGGDADDIVIGGITTYFSESTKVLNRAAIDAIMAEWTRTDGVAYATRIQHLRSGGGLNGSNFLTPSTVLNDSSAADSLFGDLDTDWFWQFAGDSIGDLGVGGTETVN